MSTAETYVTAAYLVVLGVVLLYVVIYSSKVAYLEREVERFTGQDLAPVVGAEEQEEEAQEKERVLAT